MGLKFITFATFSFSLSRALTGISSARINTAAIDRLSDCRSDPLYSFHTRSLMTDYSLHLNDPRAT